MEKMKIIEIGCCGAYCKTCPEFRNTKCKGCKIGYAEGKRDIQKARCKIKVCCFKKSIDTCADCDMYSTCETIQGFYGKKGYKYKKYEEATLFIQAKGYNNFLEVANEWKMQYGRYK
jgi:hypothetical protein